MKRREFIGGMCALALAAWSCPAAEVKKEATAMKKTLEYLRPSASKATFAEPKNLTGASEGAIRTWVESVGAER